MASGGFRLDLLLEAARLPRSTYYYQLKQLDGLDKDKEFKIEIQAIYNDHKGNYGYRRVTLELRNRSFTVNHKKVQRLMKVLCLSARIRRKRKYSSYKGEIGKKADNLIQRQFEASRTMEKCYTDVTEFAIPNSTQKLYLSPVLDGFNSEIIAYNLSCSPNLEQVKAMLEQAIVDYIDYYNNKRIEVKLKRKRQSQVTSTKPHTTASMHRLIRTMYYLITHNKLYDYTSTQNR